MRSIVAALVLFLSSSAVAQDNPAPQPTPFEQNPECGTINGVSEGMVDAFYGMAIWGLGVMTTLTPDVAVVQDFGESATWGQVSWPLAFAFAPTTAEEVYPRKCSEDFVVPSKASRVVLEPMLRIGAVDGEAAARFHLRPGYRFVYRSLDSMVGYGLGIGTTFDFAPQFEPSLSPELIVSFGECCAPGYVTVVFRYDRYFETERDVGTVQVGWTFH